MLYIGCLIILDGPNIKKISFENFLYIYTYGIRCCAPPPPTPVTWGGLEGK